VSRIATGTGDTGKTGLFDGSRVSKAHPLIRAFGDVDELDAAIGVAIAVSEKQAVKRALQQVQHELFALKGDLATPRLAAKKIRRITAEDVKHLEKLKHFIAYGGTDCAAHLQLARGIARRAERSAWDAKEAAGGINEHLIVYLNRLSDYLFLLARKVNHDSGFPEEEMRVG
jgi:cob(I)alamin adenosyltransferase